MNMDVLIDLSEKWVPIVKRVGAGGLGVPFWGVQKHPNPVGDRGLGVGTEVAYKG